MPAWSAATPIIPPSASISFTICPLASPPIAGLQDILPTDFGSKVIMVAFSPIREIARAASIPACPPPAMMIGLALSIISQYKILKKYCSQHQYLKHYL